MGQSSYGPKFFEFSIFFWQSKKLKHLAEKLMDFGKKTKLFQAKIATHSWIWQKTQYVILGEKINPCKAMRFPSFD